jgi:uncharacterized protein YkwD
MSCHWTTPQGTAGRIDTRPGAPAGAPPPALIPSQSCSELIKTSRMPVCKYSHNVRLASRGMGALAVAAMAAVLACAPGASALPAPSSTGPCTGTSLRPTHTNAPAVDAAILCLIDGVRAAHHLQPLAANSQLAAVAGRQVSSMVHLDYFSDVRPSGQTPIALVRSSSYSAHAASIAVGEIIAWGTGGNATPASIVSAWMASPPHRALILSGEFREAGIAARASVPRVLSGGSAGATYAVELGARS